MNGSKAWLAPLTGIVFVALIIAGGAIVGETPDATEDSAEEVLSFYADDDDTIFIGAALFGLAGVFLLFYAGALRKALRDAEGAGGTLSAVALGGAVVLAVGIAAQSALTIATADIAGDVEDPVVVQSLNALVWGFWMPFAVGVMTTFVAAGISVVRHGALPKWMGWVAIVAGVVMFSPAFPVAAVVVGLWVVATGVMLARRAREAAAG